ncbi:MAG: ketoacyl-ACP synthase III family protein [Actinocatenispora sp.]
MLCENLFVAGAGTYLPPAVDVTRAVAQGRYAAAAHAEYGYLSVTVSDDLAPPDMAVRAAGRALARSGHAPDDVALLLHASSWYQGVDFWPAAAHIHNEVLPGCRYAPALDMQQMSNGVGVLELAACFLAVDRPRSAVLVTSADRFAEPGFDRWAGDGMVFGDGAGALLLRRDDGVARVLSVTTVVDTGVVGAGRGDEPFGPVSGHAGFPVDVRGRRAAFGAGQLPGAVGERIRRGFVDAVDGALAEVGMRRDELARVVLPNVGRTGMWRAYLTPLGLDLAATTWDFGRSTGHVGAADQMIGFCHLVESGQLGPGDRIMLVGIGVGFSWSCAVLELVRRPDWSAPARATARQGPSPRRGWGAQTARHTRNAVS